MSASRPIAAFIALLLLPLLTSCQNAGVPDGRIMIRNDSQDRAYNTIRVSGGGTIITLDPGEESLLPAGTRRFTLSRRYEDHTREYDVECPHDLDGGIRIKMIDAHVNRISGGCKTVRADKF